MNKYKLTEEKMEWNGRTLHRICALKDFGDVKAGQLGGWIQSEENLCQDGDAWVSDNARVSGTASLCTISHIGSRDDTTTFFNRKDGKIGVTCGCFSGDIDEFAAAVKVTHGNNKYARQYSLAIQLAKEKIKTRKEGED